MTPISTDGEDSFGRRRNPDSHEEGYRWTCPICGKSRLNRAVDENGQANAVAALRTHISASQGDGHGGFNEFPAEIASLSPEEYVVHVDGRQ